MRKQQSPKWRATPASVAPLADPTPDDTGLPAQLTAIVGHDGLVELELRDARARKPVVTIRVASMTLVACLSGKARLDCHYVPTPAATPNSMPARWCNARVAEARAWANQNDADPSKGRQHVIELLSQLDRPPLPAAPVQSQLFAERVAPSARRDQLLRDVAKLPELVEKLKHNRHSMCIPPQPDDYDLLLTRIAELVPAVLQQDARF